MKKPFFLPVLAGLLLLTGCCSPETVAKLQGQGSKRIYASGYDTVWSATLGGATLSDLDIIEADQSSGHIIARRPMGDTTFGDNVSIWVHVVAPNSTQVEVVSRPAGPPCGTSRGRETVILRNIANILA
jgi:hypothetical protein